MLAEEINLPIENHSNSQPSTATFTLDGIKNLTKLTPYYDGNTKVILDSLENALNIQARQNYFKKNGLLIFSINCKFYATSAIYRIVIKQKQ